MRNIKAQFILNIEKMNFFKIRSKCITFVGIDHILDLTNQTNTSLLSSGMTVKFRLYFVASELKDPICHSDECQIGSFSSEATICYEVVISSKQAVIYESGTQRIIQYNLYKLLMPRIIPASNLLEITSLIFI